MSEIIASNMNGPNTTASNKRKRRSSFDEIDIENQRPPSKKIYSSSGEDLDSGSDVENDGVDLDLYTIGSSPPVPHNGRQRIDTIRTIRTSVGVSSSSSTTTTAAAAAAATSATTRSIANPISNNNNNNNNNHSDSNKNSFNSNDKDCNSRIGNNNNNNSSSNGQSVSLTPINNFNNNNDAIHVTEMTPQSLKKSTDSWMKCTKCFSKTDAARVCPLPLLSWANAKDVWHHMCEKDKKTAIDRTSNMLTKHHGLQPRMRAILLDWLNEVCEVYKLHRETYYLALDYLDRYLSTNVNISKTFLQLIGITCLFIAAKVEEIYPPKLSEFAYVTDGACSEEDILKQELVILSALKWQTNPITIIGWLGIYMQLQVSNSLKTNEETPHQPSSRECTSVTQQTTASQIEKTTTAMTTTTTKMTIATTTNEVDDGFVFPQFSGLEYAQTAQLLDLCTLDVDIANFPYSVTAAAAISHTFNKKIAIKLSGLEWAAIAPCYRWMEPYFQVMLQQPKLCLQEKSEQIETKLGVNSVCTNINTDDSYIIQMHTTSMEMFDQALLYREQCIQEASPAPVRTNIDHVCPPEGLLTPPDSSRKFADTHPDSTYK